MPVSSSPDQVADGLTDYLAERLVPAMDACGAEWAEALRESVSVPVQYLRVLGRQPRTGKPKPIGAKPGPGRTSRTPPQQLIIRSNPGEPPRKEFGNYYDSIVHDTRREGTLVITEIGSVLPGRGAWLEFGRDKIAARPHYQPLRQKIIAEAAGKISSKL